MHLHVAGFNHAVPPAVLPALPGLLPPPRLGCSGWRSARRHGAIVAQTLDDDEVAGMPGAYDNVNNFNLQAEPEQDWTGAENAPPVPPRRGSTVGLETGCVP